MRWGKGGRGECIRCLIKIRSGIGGGPAQEAGCLIPKAFLASRLMDHEIDHKAEDRNSDDGGYRKPDCDQRVNVVTITYNELVSAASWTPLVSTTINFVFDPYEYFHEPVASAHQVLRKFFDLFKHI